MKIAIATLDDKYFLPTFYEEVIRNYQDSVAGVVLFETKPETMSYFSFIRMQLRMLGILDFLKVLSTYIKNTILGSLPLCRKKVYTVVQLAKKHSIPIFRFSSINSEEMKRYLMENKVNVLICNIDEIIKDDIIGIQGLVCLNRHFALLPKYRGLYPLYWALKNKECYCGVTVHQMVRKIDAGVIFEQVPVKIEKNDTYLSLTKKCFEISPKIMIGALEKIESGSNNFIVQDESKQTYFSVP